jgi:hypothetical protein
MHFGNYYRITYQRQKSCVRHPGLLNACSGPIHTSANVCGSDKYPSEFSFLPLRTIAQRLRVIQSASDKTAVLLEQKPSGRVSSKFNSLSITSMDRGVAGNVLDQAFSFQVYYEHIAHRFHSSLIRDARQVQISVSPKQVKVTNEEISSRWRQAPVAALNDEICGRNLKRGD